MDLSAWFAYQLKAGMDGFIWAVHEVPAERQQIMPLKPFGEWSVARHIFHLLYYERTAVIPHMLYWLGELETFPPFDEQHYTEDGDWEKYGQAMSIEQLLREFQEVRETQIALLPRFSAELWLAKKPNGWIAEHDIKWIISKTFQHTAEHTHDVMAIALFWEGALRYLQQQASQETPAD